MNLMRISILLFLSFVIPAIASAQTVASSKDYALIFPRTGDGFAGNIIRIDPDTLVVFTTNFTYVAKKDIGKIILHPKKESGQGFTIGSITVFYGLNYLLGTTSGQPAPFLSSNIYGGNRYETSYQTPESGSILGIAFLGLLFGGGIGYLTDHSSQDDIVFLFDPQSPNNADEWTELGDRIHHGKKHRNYRLNVSAGSVISSVQNQYYDDLKGAGYSIGQYYYYSSFDNANSVFNTYSYTDPPTDFSWLRSLSLSRKIDDHYEIGLAYSLFGEPSYLSTLGSSFSGTSDKIVGQRFSGRGYYATGTYGMYLDQAEDFEATFTAGLGLAKVDFDLDAQAQLDTIGGPVQVVDRISVHKNYLSAMASAGISYYIYDAISFGLSANYFLSGSEKAKAMPFVGLKEHDLNFSNLDIGFTIGLHF
jgi:hypothetical protein